LTQKGAFVIGEQRVRDALEQLQQSATGAFISTAAVYVIVAEDALQALAAAIYGDDDEQPWTVPSGLSTTRAVTQTRPVHRPTR
jgi:hypothetical protein